MSAGAEVSGATSGPGCIYSPRGQTYSTISVESAGIALNCSDAQPDAGYTIIALTSGCITTEVLSVNAVHEDVSVGNNQVILDWTGTRGETDSAVIASRLTTVGRAVAAQLQSGALKPLP